MSSTPNGLTIEDLNDLSPSWEIALRAARKPLGTLVTHRKGIDQLIAYAVEKDLPPLDRSTVRSSLQKRACQHPRSAGPA